MPEPDRIDYIGGSDVPDLIQLEPWGCSRRLYYSKLPVEQDFPFHGNYHTKRGQRLEEIAIEEYEVATGRWTYKIGFVQDPKRPWRCVHGDREQEGMDNKGMGLVEAKCPAVAGFSRIRMQGIPLAYEVQLQWGLGLLGHQWGTVVVFNADYWALIWKDYERDDELIELMLERGEESWRIILNDRLMGMQDNIPEPLPVSDRRCISCPWRARCKSLGDYGEEIGHEEVPEVAPVKDYSLSLLAGEYLDAHAAHKDAKDNLDELKEQLKALMGERIAVDAGNALIYQTLVKMPDKVIKAHTQKRIRVRGKKNGD